MILYQDKHDRNYSKQKFIKECFPANIPQNFIKTLSFEVQININTVNNLRHLLKVTTSDEVNMNF